MDAKPLFTAPSIVNLEERHHFHHRHRRRFFGTILCAALPLILLLHRTGDAVFHLYMLLAGSLGVWLLLVHARPAPSAVSHRLPKELAVGLFFPAAVFIPTVARAPALRPALALPAASLAALCTLNCLFLFAWEHPLSGLHAHPTTRWAVHFLVPLAATTCTLEVLAIATANKDAGPPGLRGLCPLPHLIAPLLACSLSTVLLLVLHACRSRLPKLTLRAGADFVLLTPIPVALALSLLSHYP